ncbi:ribonuclease H2 subunit C-like [Haliotis cracherodii]|uniref:ribonuclease H2 subunit C-like n=1 Tax=Haliotis cracherodii TaxID=6455 RepID=UPI0039E9566A
MSVYLNTSSVPGVVEESCHLMPFNIEHDGSANVSSYFKTSIREEQEALTASFRGRPLNGQEVTLPSGYTGIVVKENRKPVTEDEDRDLNITHRFQKMTYWNLDKLPSADDRFAQAMQWADIAKALHRPVDEESSQKSVTGK